MSQSVPAANMVKKETALLIGFCCLVAGFLGGVGFAAFKSPANVASQQAGAAAKMTPEQSQKLLALEQEVQKNPNNGDAWTKMGHLYFDSDQPEKAIIAYNKSLELSPNNADVITDLGVMYRNAGDPKKAVETFDRAISVNPRHETARFNKGIVLLYDLKDEQAAAKSWQELIALNPMAAAPNGQLVSEIMQELLGKPQKK
ncbi:MAG: tetratricopeptide repeat protein [Thermodesulfobacteriota bacterium]